MQVICIIIAYLLIGTSVVSITVPAAKEVGKGLKVTGEAIGQVVNPTKVVEGP